MKYTCLHTFFWANCVVMASRKSTCECPMKSSTPFLVSNLMTIINKRGGILPTGSAIILAKNYTNITILFSLHELSIQDQTMSGDWCQFLYFHKKQGVWNPKWVIPLVSRKAGFAWYQKRQPQISFYGCWSLPPAQSAFHRKRNLLRPIPWVFNFQNKNWRKATTNAVLKKTDPCKWRLGNLLWIHWCCGLPSCRATKPLPANCRRRWSDLG